MSTLLTIAEQVRKCTRCPLWKHRLQALPGEGKQNVKLLIVLESPDEIADRKGNLWDGKVGRQLLQLLKEKKITKDQVFLTSLVKCSPKGSPVDIREIEECHEYMKKQIDCLNSLEHIFVISKKKTLPVIDKATYLKEISELKEELKIAIVKKKK
ncbi:hypothetical protein CL619_00990 [archaeon]|nr:hypothetical protein [archaeon]|tara:strand:- start:1786 stop:2250 length:465 start_codon:yes stop_codon:yes gene_type:complete